MSTSISFHVAGIPAPQGSKRHVGNGRMIESSKALPAWRAAVKAAVEAAHHGEPIEGPIEIHLEFVMPRPKSWGKNRQDPMIQRPDVDKLIRAVFDSITGVMVRDDSQFIRVKAFKRRAAHGEPTGVLVDLHHENSRSCGRIEDESGPVKVLEAPPGPNRESL